MADNATINNKSYIGFQTGLGFAASADKQLPNISIVPVGVSPVRPINTVGEDHPTAVQHGIIESDVTVTGDVMDFVGLGYAAEAFYGTVSPSTVGVTGKQRVYEPGTTAPRYFTNDFGSSVRFKRAIDCFLHSLHYHATLNETVFDGSGKAQLFKDSVLDSLTLAASPTLVAQKTPDPLKSGLAIASSLSGLDTAGYLNRALTFDLAIADRWGTIHTMNPSLAGAYDGVIRKRPSAGTGMIQVGGDDDGWAWLTRVLGNTIVYVRYSVFGDEIAAGTAEVQTVDLSGDDDPTGGTWTLTLPMFGGKVLTGLAWNISAATLQATINSLVYRGANLVTVGKVGFVYTITFPAILGNVGAVSTDNGAGLTGGGGDTFAITILTTTPGVASINYLVQIDAAVAASEIPKQVDGGEGAEGLDVVDVPLLLMKTATLNGHRLTLINEVAAY